MDICLTENAKKELEKQNSDKKALRIFVQGVG